MYLDKAFLKRYFQFLFVVFLMTAAAMAVVAQLLYLMAPLEAMGLGNTQAVLAILIPNAAVISYLATCFSFSDWRLQFRMNFEVLRMLLTICAAAAGFFIVSCALYLMYSALFSTLVGYGVHKAIAIPIAVLIDFALLGLVAAIRKGAPK